MRIKGSHYYYYNRISEKIAVVPFYSKDIRKGTLHAILKDAEMSIEALQDHLKLCPEEGYSDVIDRLAGIALDEEPLDSKTQDRIAEALKDLKEGRYLTRQEIRKMLESS